jgi:hypothetical protein
VTADRPGWVRLFPPGERELMGEAVETYFDGEAWRNRVCGRDALPGEYRSRGAAAEVGRSEARIRGVVHVIRRTDGSVEERNRYPRRSEELPG